MKQVIWDLGYVFFLIKLDNQGEGVDNIQISLTSVHITAWVKTVHQLEAWIHYDNLLW